MSTTLIILISWLFGIATHYIFEHHLWPRRGRIYTWIFKFRNHRESGEPCKTDRVLDRIGYSLGYDYKRKSALWAAYIISKHSVGINYPRSTSFYADTEIPFKHRVLPEEYEGSGYDKGHLVPSASVDFSRKSNKETFVMSNIVLQDPTLNRQAWGHLEAKERKWTETKGKLLVIAGPVYGKRNKRIGNLSVPRMMYKVIYSYEDERCIGFLFPNKAVTNAQLWKYAVPVRHIEEETGYIFFTEFDNDIQMAKQECDIEWWQHEPPKTNKKS